MQEILTIGSSLIDIFITSEYFQVMQDSEGAKLCQMYGEKLEVEAFEIRTGGGGSNAAVAFARAGYSVAAISETGKDLFANIIMEEFHKEYVSTNFVVQEKKEQTGGSVILVGKDGGRTVMVHRGASSLLDGQDIPHRALKTAQWVHLSSISGQLDALKVVIETLKEGAPKLSWNPGKKELALLKTGQLKVTDIPAAILFVNQAEWDSVAGLQQNLRQHIPEIVITNGGAAGKLLRRENPDFEFSPPQVKVVDETGAGDAFAVGYVIAKLQGKQPQEAIQWGMRNSHSVIQSFGAKSGLLTREKLAGT